MQQHERPSGRRHAPAPPSRRPRVRLAPATTTAAALTAALTGTLTGTLLSSAAGPATAADGTHAPRADFDGDGSGDVASSASGAYASGSGSGSGNKDAGPPTPTGSRTVSPSATGVSGTSPTGYPDVGANLAA
ncbi:hypothetical protein [Streptomyces paradoxus]|uniref:hypothetical protein n=1 Tax=Streptomyces paradoxus TaxID=66375 RepID=UPI0037CF0D86